VSATGVSLMANRAAACYPPAPPVYKKVVTYKTVEEQVVTKVPYQKKVVKYDECGKPYCVYVTCYKEVVETVCKQVPVVTWVKVCG
jgi:hypothetical protein